ncbi:MAG: FkbM family methyltransferase [Candidatus Omnitrophica bacterium]|nr:FkbM family methyltransferase [Candidatus Omnitrophota bacterium]
MGVIDVGSRGGIHPRLRPIASIIDVVGFEPDAEEVRRLQGEETGLFRSVRHLPYALGQTDGRQTLHLCRSRGTSSFLKPNRPFLDRFPDASRFDVETAQSVEVKSLDGLIQGFSGGLPRQIDFLKLDTQGSELLVLKGAHQTLRSQVVALDIEVEFAPLYESQPLFRDVDAYLAECGFTLFKLRRMEWVRRGYAERPYRSGGQIVFGEAVYLKDPLSNEQWSPTAHQVEALVLLAILYGQHDFVKELMELAPIQGRCDVPAIRAVLERNSRRSNFEMGTNPLRQAWRSMGTLWDQFRRRSSWGRGDPWVGN